MLRSLVGSEMCIRDRPRTYHTMTTQQPSSEPTMHVDRYERGWMIAAVIMLVSFAVAVTVAAVSYTHLTLPTIYSV